MRQIDLMTIYNEAPYIFIADRRSAEPVGDENLYWWRYWGTAIRDLTGIEATGKFLHETHQPVGAIEAREDYDTVLATGHPSHWRRNVRTVGEDRTFLVYERIVFPLADSEGDPAHILGVFTTNDPGDISPRSGEELSHGKIDIYERSKPG